MEGQDELYLYKVIKYKRGYYYYYQVASSVILALKFNRKIAKPMKVTQTREVGLMFDMSGGERINTYENHKIFLLVRNLEVSIVC